MYEEDIKVAKEARMNAYSPYSKYCVGACLRTKSGKVYKGCNVENHGVQSYCAERTAFLKALSEGERDFASIVIVGAPEGLEPTEECMPCGYCRQFMSEFVDKNFKITAITGENEIKEHTIDEILPYGFKF